MRGGLVVRVRGELDVRVRGGLYVCINKAQTIIPGLVTFFRNVSPLKSYTFSPSTALTTPNVVIDGYTVSSTLNSPATLTLGTTVILVCRISGIPHGLQINYHWTCPNGLCQQTGYAGRKINNNIIAINITSTSDGGIYTCTVTAEGREASQQFQLNVNGQCLQVHVTSTVCTYPW